VKERNVTLALYFVFSIDRFGAYINCNPFALVLLLPLQSYHKRHCAVHEIVFERDYLQKEKSENGG
jgi:hypothetical protein